MDFDPSKNYYDMLWVSEDASADDIKKAFRKLAMTHHPDKKWWDKAKFQEINEAYGVVSDDKKRQQYDMYRKHGWSAGGMWGAGWFGGGFGGFGQGGFEVDLGDVMDQFFGWGRGRSSGGPQPGEDIQVSLNITFEEAYTGISKTIEFSRKTKVSGAKEEECPTCKGRGRVMQQSQTIFGVMQTQNICPTCQWVGRLYTKDGKKLSGWLETTKETLTVNVPAGINDGVFIRHSTKGDEGIAGGGAGDLYIKINVQTSTKYTRQGEDIIIKASMTIFDLVLGGEIQVPHPTGTKSIKVPKGTQITDKIKIAGLGFPKKGGVFSSAGDLYVIPQVAIPKKLSKEEEKLWKELQELNEK